MTSTPMVSLPLDQAKALVLCRYCSVCLGVSPSWDGHDANPPCRGKALETLAAAVKRAEVAS